MSRARGWTCQRQSNGRRCGTWNAPRTRKCGSCGKPRPPKREPAHMAALDLSYEDYVRLNGGEFCGICGQPRSSTRKLDRDHDHKTGKPRGLLCRKCNRQLRTWLTVEWMLAAIRYMRGGVGK